MNVSLEDTQKKLDKALKRNLEGQGQGQAKAIAAPTKLVEPEASETSEAEPITDTED